MIKSITTTPYPRRSDKNQAAWLADKIVALGDYAKEAAQLLRRWPDTPMTISPEDHREVFRQGWNGALDEAIARISRLGLFIGDGDAIRLQITEQLKTIKEKIS